MANLCIEMSRKLIAAHLTLSARLRESDGPPTPGRIDVDATGYRRDEDRIDESRTPR